MIGLDTPFLLRVLRGEARARAFLKTVEGEELATTEWNLLELESLAGTDPSPGKERRRASLERLRRRMTVLPIDERAGERFRAAQATPRTPEELTRCALLATLEARGCRLLVTGGALSPAPGRWKVRSISG